MIYTIFKLRCLFTFVYKVSVYYKFINCFSFRNLKKIIVINRMSLNALAQKKTRQRADDLNQNNLIIRISNQMIKDQQNVLQIIFKIL